LPGLSVAQDVSHFHATSAHIKSIDEAFAKKQAEEAAAAAAVQATNPATTEGAEPSEQAKEAGPATTG
jgi:hypothetical protein